LPVIRIIMCPSLANGDGRLLFIKYFFKGDGMPIGRACNKVYCLVTSALFEGRYIIFFGPYHAIGFGLNA
jgi:hypothetical protein